MSTGLSAGMTRSEMFVVPLNGLGVCSKGAVGEGNIISSLSAEMLPIKVCCTRLLEPRPMMVVGGLGLGSSVSGAPN
jgi:hypothetical protein